MNLKVPHIFRAVFFFICLKLHSQTLTCAYSCPQIGQVFSIKTCSPVAQTYGLNQLWNFTQLEAVSPNNYITSFLDPASASSSSLFAQVSVVKSEFGNYSFLETGTNGVKLSAANNSSVSAQSVILPLPFSYGSSHSETIVTTFQNGVDTIRLTSKKSLSGVGTGTLMLPTGTYTDVLRISGKIVESQTKNGLPNGNVYTTRIDYYYSEKISYPLFYTSFKESTGMEDYGPYTQFVSEFWTGIKNENNEITLGIQVAPNPTSGTVRLISTINTEGKIVLINSFGEILLNQHCLTGTTELDLIEFPAGLYTLQIWQGNNTQSKKIVVRR